MYLGTIQRELSCPNSLCFMSHTPVCLTNIIIRIEFFFSLILITQDCAFFFLFYIFVCHFYLFLVYLLSYFLC